jgi:hypothetical protein
VINRLRLRKIKTKINLKNQEALLREKIESLKAQIDQQRMWSNNKLADILTLDLVRISHELRHNLYLQERRKGLKRLAVLGTFAAALCGIVLLLTGVH